MLGVLSVAAAGQLLKQWMRMDAAHFAAALAPIDGKSLLVQIQSPLIAILLTVDGGTISLEPFIAGHQTNLDYPAGLFEPTSSDMARQNTGLNLPEADTTLYLATAADGLSLIGTSLGEAGNVNIKGDLSFLQKLVDAFSQAKPDIGSLIQPLLGDSVAHAAHNLVTTGLNQLRRHTSTAQWHATEWLQEDNTMLAKRWQFEQFTHNLTALQLRLDRLSARVNTSSSTAAPSNIEAFSPTPLV